MPAKAPAVEKSIDEKENIPAPHKLGMRDPTADPTNTPTQTSDLMATQVQASRPPP